MATTSIAGSTVTFSSSGVAADMNASLTEGGSLAYTFDVLAASGGGKAASIYSVDDGDIDMAPVTVNKAFAGYDTDLLYKDATYSSADAATETTDKGAKFWIGTDGKVHYDASALQAQIDALGAGDTFTDTFEYTIRLANGTLSVGTLMVVINGTNDVPTVTASSTEDTSVTEAGSSGTGDASAGGKLTIADVDAGESYFQVPASLAGTYGTFSFAADGTWSYLLDDSNPATQALAAGVTKTETLTVTSADGTKTYDIIVTVHGGNDAPTGTASAQLSDGWEDTGYIVSAGDLLAGFADDDSGDVLSISGLSADHGTVIDNGDGTFTVSPEADYHGTITLNYTVSDGNGGTVAATQTFTLANVEDEATGTLGVSGTAEEGGSLIAALTGVSDADGATTTAYQWQEKIGGTWTDIAGADDATLSIPDDQSYVGKEVRVVATTTDVLGGTTTFEGDAQTIVNVDDEATGTLGVSGTAEEGGSLIAALTGVSDADGATTTAYQWQENIGGTWTDIAGADGATLPIPDDQSYVGKEVRVVATTTDVLGGTTTFEGDAQTIINVNDAPALTGTPATLGNGTEDVSYQIDRAALLQGYSDADGDTVEVADLVVNHGSLTANTNGWLFTPDANYNGPVTVSYSVIDGNLGVPAVRTFNLAAVNDAATVGLSNVVTSTPENGAAFKVADITITDVDAATSNNVLSLAGADASSFHLVGNELWFNGGADFETKTSYGVTVQVDDTGVSGSPDGTQSTTLAITDVVETVPATPPTTFTATGDPNDYDTATGSATVTLVGTGGGGGNTNGTGGADLVVGTAGSNNLGGGNGNDTIFGAAAGDNIQGQGDDDTLYGQAGGDNVSGGNGNDFIFGGSGADTLNGNDNNDTIYGGSGNDTIDGGAGSDTIVGGYGADTINPGESDGAVDTVRYLSLLDTNDTISGFVSGTDKVDLSSIDANDTLAGNQGFAWGGQEAGPVVEAHSVTWYTTGGNVVVLADTDGVLTTAEFSITLTGITSIADTDFNTL